MEETTRSKTLSLKVSPFPVSSPTSLAAPCSCSTTNAGGDAMLEETLLKMQSIAFLELFILAIFCKCQIAAIHCATCLRPLSGVSWWTQRNLCKEKLPFGRRWETQLEGQFFPQEQKTIENILGRWLASWKHRRGCSSFKKCQEEKLRTIVGSATEIGVDSMVTINYVWKRNTCVQVKLGTCIQ